MTRIFLLSPASATGRRARLLFSERATFPLAQRLRTPDGVELGAVFSFLSGLYFRGKLAYATAFATPPPDVPGVLVITPSRGLLLPESRVTLADLGEFATVPVDLRDARYRLPFEMAAVTLAQAAGADCDVILLGSIATGKYVDVLLAVFGERLRFPVDFIGRGDMSRGGLMLRHVDAGRELEYVPVGGTERRGPRPPKLAPRR